MQKTDYALIGETLYTQTLGNGLRIRVVPKPGYRKTFAVFATDYGGADRHFTLAGEEKCTPAGVAHYLEHKMFDMPSGNVLMELESRGANPNAFTSDAMTAYHFECIDHFEENLKTLLNFVNTPYFTQESVDKERGIIGQEIRMCEDSPDYRVYMNLMRCLFQKSVLRDSVAGTVESIADITPQTLYDCHKVFYSPSNMALCVVGAVDPERVSDIARNCLTPEGAEKPGRQYGAAEDAMPVCEKSEEHMVVSAPQFTIGAKGGPVLSGQEALRERVTGSLALLCLAGTSSPFYIRLYGQGLLNATFGYDLGYAAGESMILLGGESRDPQAVLLALRQELHEVSDRGLDRALFERQKKASYGRRLRALGSFEGLAVGLAEGAFAQFCPLDAFSILSHITADDCDGWIRQKLSPERLSMSVIRPKE